MKYAEPRCNSLQQINPIGLWCVLFRLHLFLGESCKQGSYESLVSAKSELSNWLQSSQIFHCKTRQYIFNCHCCIVHLINLIVKFHSNQPLQYEHRTECNHAPNRNFSSYRGPSHISFLRYHQDLRQSWRRPRQRRWCYGRQRLCNHWAEDYLSSQNCRSHRFWLYGLPEVWPWRIPRTSSQSHTITPNDANLLWRDQASVSSQGTEAPCDAGYNSLWFSSVAVYAHHEHRPAKIGAYCFQIKEKTPGRWAYPGE